MAQTGRVILKSSKDGRSGSHPGPGSPSPAPNSHILLFVCRIRLTMKHQKRAINKVKSHGRGGRYVQHRSYNLNFVCRRVWFVRAADDNRTMQARGSQLARLSTVQTALSSPQGRALHPPACDSWPPARPHVPKAAIPCAHCFCSLRHCANTRIGRGLALDCQPIWLTQDRSPAPYADSVKAAAVRTLEGVNDL